MELMNAPQADMDNQVVVRFRYVSMKEILSRSRTHVKFLSLSLSFFLSVSLQVPQIFDVSNLTNSSEYWSPNLGIYAEALTEDGTISNSCGRVNIMGTIVQDAAPYLFPFIIEYSLIGAAVIYVMWKHIGRHPRWPHQSETDLERCLEAILSRRAVALAHAGNYSPFSLFSLLSAFRLHEMREERPLSSFMYACVYRIS